MMAGASLKPGEMIVGINVTPMVDIVLVLLIILMVTASYTVSRTVPLELPQAATGESAGADPLAVSIDKDGALFLDGKSVTAGKLREGVQKAAREGLPKVLIAADGRTAHRSVVLVIDLLRSEGVTKFAINVAPEDLSP
jgi:biopolymer transport protein ExbD